MADIFNGDSVRKPSWLTRAAPSRLVAAAGFCLFSLLVLIVLIRRLAGAFTGSISLLGYLGCLWVAGMICCGLKITAESQHRLDRRATLIFGSLFGLPLDVLAISLLPANWSYSWLALACAWSVLVGWFCLSRRSVDWLLYGVLEVIWPEIERFLFPISAELEVQLAKSPPLDERFPTQPLSHRVAAEAPAYRECEGDVISELQRRSTAMGGELLEGQLVAVFAAGARQAVLHVPFIPPFTVAPHLECEIADGSDARIKVAAIFPYGARLELKRNTSDLLEQRVTLEIYAEVVAASPAEAA